jgi:carboxypeptidase family protein
MKASVVLSLILFLTITTYGQRNSTTDTALPAPGSTGTVTLSLAEYDRLVELASRKPKTADAAPLPFVLTRAAFKLKLVEQTLVGTVDIDGSLLENGNVKAPLTSGLLILDARQIGNQPGNPLPLLQEGPSHAAILNGPGPFGVSLGIASGLTIDAGRASFVLPVPLAGTSLLTLELPGNHANVRIEPGIVTSRTSANGNTIVEAALEPGKPARVWWTTREVAAPVAQREVRFLSDVKTVVSVGDSQVRLTAYCDVTVIQGEAADFKMALPAGYELAVASGTTLESSDVTNGTLTLTVHDSAKRNHQFLIAIERTNGDTKVEAPLLAFAGAQRETGELLVEGVGAMELVAKETGGLRRMDVREAAAITRSLAHFPLQAAFRYNRRASDAPKLNLEWTQFPDANILSAVAERATVTTLTTVEGKSLTEVTLRIRNHAQPYLKVVLPQDAQLLSTEVEGERVKPLGSPDGSRVPLLRAGLDSSRAYTVSFVYLNAGSRFTKNGTYDMALPKLDIPVNVLTWEVLLPDRLAVKQFGGNAIAAEYLPAATQDMLAANFENFDEIDAAAPVQNEIELSNLQPGQVGGIVTDVNGAVVAGASVTVVNNQTGASLSTRSDSEGRWAIDGVSAGPTRITVDATGFKKMQHEMNLVALQPGLVGTTLEVGQISEVVTVQAGVANSITLNSVRKLEELGRQNRAAQLSRPSDNVTNLQRRVAGILPVRIDVPKSGRSYRFVRTLVLEEETRISFNYKAK